MKLPYGPGVLHKVGPDLDRPGGQVAASGSSVVEGRRAGDREAE
ncbi:MAG TPA: hypothetical protein VHN18_20880 [Micromonosporaceae bacterium]|nr:hypothetical protein [Micromonosporaceae bacterium]